MRFNKVLVCFLFTFCFHEKSFPEFLPLDIEEKLLGAMDFVVKENNFEKAKKSYTESIEKVVKEYGRNSPEFAEANFAIALIKHLEYETEMGFGITCLKENCQTKLNEVEQLYKDSLRILRSHNLSSVLEGEMLLWLGQLLTTPGGKSKEVLARYSEAELYLKESLEIFRKKNKGGLSVDSLKALANNLKLQGKFSEEEFYRKRILIEIEEIGDPVIKAKSKLDLADSIAEQGIDSSHIYEEAFNLVRELEGFEELKHDIADDLEMSLFFNQKSDKAIFYSKYKYELASSFLGKDSVMAYRGLIDLGLSSCFFDQFDTCWAVRWELNQIFDSFIKGEIEPKFISWETKKETPVGQFYKSMDEFFYSFYSKGSKLFEVVGAEEDRLKWIRKSEEYIFDGLEGSESVADHIWALDSKAERAKNNGDSEKAISIYKEIVSIIENDNYIVEPYTVSNIARNYSDLLYNEGKYRKSLEVIYRFLEREGAPFLFKLAQQTQILLNLLEIGHTGRIVEASNYGLRLYLKEAEKAINSASNTEFSHRLLYLISNQVLPNKRISLKERMNILNLYIQAWQLLNYSSLEEVILKTFAKREFESNEKILGLIELFESKKKVFINTRNQYLSDGSGQVYVDPSTHKDLFALEEELNNLRNQLIKEAPSYLDLTTIKTFSLKEVQQILPENAALLLNLEDKLSGTSLITLIEKRKVDYFFIDEIYIGKFENKYKNQIEKINNLELHGERSTPFASYMFYELLLKEIFPPSKKIEHLYVDNYFLADLPIHSLIQTRTVDLDSSYFKTKSYDWILNDYSLSGFTSIPILMSLLNNEFKVKEDMLIGFGDPLLSKESELIAAVNDLFRGEQVANIEEIKKFPSLPDTAEELYEISKYYPKNTLYLREEANESNIKETDLSEATVLVFATHGVLIGEIDGIRQPGLILTPPILATEKDDGVLTAKEISQLNLNADLVILSACDTAAAGDDRYEPFSGLAQAFFAAGARNVLATSGKISSEAATILTPEIIRLKKETPDISYAEALRISMLNMANNKDKVHLRHPFYWSSYSLISTN